jgi:hypothetical protein
MVAISAAWFYQGSAAFIALRRFVGELGAAVWTEHRLLASSCSKVADTLGPAKGNKEFSTGPQE